jgi:hypothetical protein
VWRARAGSSTTIACTDTGHRRRDAPIRRDKAAAAAAAQIREFAVAHPAVLSAAQAKCACLMQSG